MPATIRILICSSLLAILSGCITAQESVMASAKAVTPISPGRFDIQELTGERRTFGQTGVLTLAKDQYVWTQPGENGEQSEQFRMFDIGSGFYLIGKQRMKREKRFIDFDLIEHRDGAYYRYKLQCDDLLNNGIADKQGFTIDTEILTPGFFVCDFSDSRTLIAAVLSAPRRYRPLIKYVPLK